MAATRGCPKQKHPPSLGNVYMLQSHTLLPKLTNLPTPPSSVACLFDLPFGSPLTYKAAHIAFASRSTISSRRLQACQGLQRLAKAWGSRHAALPGLMGVQFKVPPQVPIAPSQRHHNVKINDLLQAIHKQFAIGSFELATKACSRSPSSQTTLAVNSCKGIQGGNRTSQA